METTHRDRYRSSVKLAVLALVVVGLVALLGGFRAAPAKGPRMVRVGESVDLGPMRVRPLRAWVDAKCPLDYSAGEPNSCLSVEAEVTNLTHASRSGVDEIIKLVTPSPPKGTFPMTELVRDRAILAALHPRMPERVVISYKLPSPLAAPSSRITLALWSMRFKKRDNLLGGEGWFSPAEAARVELPLSEPDPDAMRVVRQ
jgi:hypothetical protein